APGSELGTPSGEDAVVEIMFATDLGRAFQTVFDLADDVEFELTGKGSFQASHFSLSGSLPDITCLEEWYGHMGAVQIETCARSRIVIHSRSPIPHRGNREQNQCSRIRASDTHHLVPLSPGRATSGISSPS